MGTKREHWGPTVQVDDEGNLIDVASALTDDLRRAHDYHCEAANHLRMSAAMRAAAMRGKRDDTAAEWLLAAKKHDRVAVRLYEAVVARGEVL
jgi:hypothetical protein